MPAVSSAISPGLTPKSATSAIADETGPLRRDEAVIDGLANCVNDNDRRTVIDVELVDPTPPSARRVFTPRCDVPSSVSAWVRLWPPLTLTVPICTFESVMDRRRPLLRLG